MSNTTAGVTLLDGGMGQELVARGVAGSETLWSAAALLDAPEEVLAVHRDYIEAGADVITTNSYAAGRDRLEKVGVGHLFEQLNRTAGELAVRAREETHRPVRIAGSLGPLRGTFNPDAVGAFEELVPLYAEQAELLLPHVDLFLCETMSTAEEARAALTAAAATGREVWVSWTLAEEGEAGALRDGSGIAAALAAVADLPVAAVLVNCVQPERITAAMAALVDSGRPAGGFANGFVGIPDGWVVTDGLPDARNDLDAAAYAGHAIGWVDQGAQIVGGCCEVGPAHIRRLREQLDVLGST
ncbi:homocysteine S-methyltransferase family protein [Euzebya tangerina]|uniref:homocysteine S-methyltransferase family protein n=1 Tax=Euzebya tangerina TaxID=591198 RepID=UPI000E3172F3|nr:homocysteine S-methyltransferase family protein [Euzebya tangerina]